MGNKKSTVKKVFGIIGTVFFFITYLPFLYLIVVGYDGMTAGLFGGIEIYGFEAMGNAFLWLCIIPVFPVCIIYQLIFGIAYIRKHKTLKAVTIGIVVTLALMIVGAGLFAINKNQKQLEEAKPEIEQYLSDKYGEGFINADTGIRLMNPNEDSYMVTTDVLPEGIEFCVYRDDEYDNLINSFLIYNDGFEDEFEEYVNEQYDLPDNMSIRVNIDAIDFGSYHHGDDYTYLFDRVDYSVSGIEADIQDVDDDVVVNLIYEVWEEQFPKFEDQIIYLGYFTLFVKDNGSYAYSVVYYVDAREVSISLYRPTDRVSDLDGEYLVLP